MRTFIFVILLSLFPGGFYYWYELNQASAEKHEKILLENISTEEMKKTFLQINASQNENKTPAYNTDAQNRESSDFLITIFDWQLYDEIPGNEVQKNTTTTLLNILKSADTVDAGSNISRRKEIEDAIVEFNKDPKNTAKIFKYLLEQPEVKDFDGVVANLLKISSYIQFDKSELVKTSIEIVNSSILVDSATRTEDQDSKNQIIKIKEAAKLVIENIKYNQNNDDAVSFVKNALAKQKNTIIRTELLSQLEMHFPEEAKLLDKQAREEREEDISDYRLRELNVK